MTETECIAAMEAKVPVIHCVTATHDEIEYECIIGFKAAEGRDSEDITTVALKSRTGNSTTLVKPENIRIKGDLGK